MKIKATISEYIADENRLVPSHEEIELPDIITSNNRIFVDNKLYIISQTYFFDELTNYGYMTKDKFKQVLFLYNQDEFTPSKYFQLEGEIIFEDNERGIFYKPAIVNINHTLIKLSLPLPYIRRSDIVQVDGKTFMVGTIELNQEGINLKGTPGAPAHHMDFIKKAANYFRRAY